MFSLSSIAGLPMINTKLLTLIDLLKEIVNWNSLLLKIGSANKYSGTLVLIFLGKLLRIYMVHGCAMVLILNMGFSMTHILETL